MENSQTDTVIHKLAKHFFNGSYNFQLDASEVQLLCVSTQDKLLNLTMNSKLVQKYPVSYEFTKLYLKRILSYLEPNQEVNDGIYDFMCSIMSNKQGANSFCYRHYVIDDNFHTTITIKETKNMVINGTTGLKTWEAALLLTDWIMCNKNVFKEKKVLELGSGVGFTGITVGKLCDIKSIILTDCHNEVLQTINDNIQINFPRSNKHSLEKCNIYTDGNRTIGVAMLDWNEFDQTVCEEAPDIIIGADIVYDPSILKPLTKVLKSFFERNKALHVFIACIVRNEDTLNDFYNILDLQSLSVEEIEIARNVHLQWDSKIKRRFVKINNKTYYRVFSCIAFLLLVYLQNKEIGFFIP